MLQARIAAGQATGIICSPEKRDGWLDRIRTLPLLQEMGTDTFYHPSGAVVVVRASTKGVREWGSRDPRPTLWLDDENMLNAPLPAPKSMDED